MRIPHVAMGNSGEGIGRVREEGGGRALRSVLARLRTAQYTVHTHTHIHTHSHSLFSSDEVIKVMK